ncbi:hypothetical protein [Bradyrhizobium neotropicale]|nr:hypothetical protein [Bradyrhizobium neotropicale]
MTEQGETAEAIAILLAEDDGIARGLKPMVIPGRANGASPESISPR